ncbi:hypothetical protein PA598K_04121 [Paenibacillus sp. 598K]|nr:hypothetical protein PA598K_04121 [Paenibacillus sp. 598K]
MENVLLNSKFGLHTNDTGTLLKNGLPYKGVGVNFFNGFSRVLADPADSSYVSGFEELKRYGVPFIRFMAGGYWPSDNRLYLEDKAAYYERMDAFVAAAERLEIGLLPSLFWYHANVPDLMGEPRSCWGVPGSRTLAFLEQYTTEMVQRYAGSPAIWGWEFGNEYNLEQDLPNAEHCRPPIVPLMGTAETRSAEDDLGSDMLHTAYRLFAETVRKHDPHRIVISGSSIPRATAWHQLREGIFADDTEAQFQAMLAWDSPDPFDVLSAHYYLSESERFGEQRATDKLLRLMQETARQTGKPLFIGEFGVPDTLTDGTVDPARARALIEEMTEALRRADVPLSALWVYDYKYQPDTTVTGTNERAYQLELLQRWNAEYKLAGYQP